MRRKIKISRETTPDPRFSSAMVSQFINYMMKGGKKSTAEALFYKAMDLIEERSGKKGLEVFTTALNNVKPHLEVTSRRIGGANYQVPVEVRPSRRTALGMRWLLQFCAARVAFTTMFTTWSAALGAMLSTRGPGSVWIDNSTTR